MAGALARRRAAEEPPVQDRGGGARVRRYDPDRNLGTKCDPLQDPFSQGIGRALNDLATLIREGRFPG